MRISKMKLKNFRGYKDEVTIDFCNLTAFVGKNDVGKSSILEALDIFINENKGVIKVDKDDVNKQNANAGDNDIKISVIFDELPENIIIDSTNSTTLTDEYLLDKNGHLEIVKIYSNGSTKEKVFIKANHPTNPQCSDLLLKKMTDLKKVLDTNKIECSDKTKCAVVRKSIWDYFCGDLQLQEVEIDVSKEDAKKIWEQLKNYVPVYSLFQCDRKNSDGDSEIQDPLKLAVQEVLRDESLQKNLMLIANEVEKKLKETANRTLEKLKEMNPEIADSLNPVIPTTESLKWADVFKSVSITGDEDIPINKRGSGVKRLILLNFFRAEAERRKKEKDVPNIIFAMEEPETSQHPGHQRKLIDAFIELSKATHTQVFLTTHSPSIVKQLEFENLRLIKDSKNKDVLCIVEHDLPYPSLNEVNYLAFSESNEEYHNELYGFIEAEDKLEEFKKGKTTKEYIKLEKGGKTKKQQKIASEFIRHQIHHPENKHNTRFSFNELQNSIKEMRKFIKENINV